MSLLHQDDEHETEAPERELTLSTGALIGIFAGLVLLCALFFALGYTVRGRQNPRPTLAAVSTDAAPASSANFNTFKPAAGSPAGSAAATHIAPAPVETSPEPQPADALAPLEAAPSAPKEAAPLVHPPATAPHSAAPAAVTTPPAVIPPGSFIVQVAAVSHPEDAEYVVAALKAKGYPAASRTVPQDKLYHIQVGPYTNLKDAEAIKQRLSADGYNNPIVK